MRALNWIRRGACERWASRRHSRKVSQAVSQWATRGPCLASARLTGPKPASGTRVQGSTSLPDDFFPYLSSAAAAAATTSLAFYIIHRNTAHGVIGAEWVRERCFLHNSSALIARLCLRRRATSSQKSEKVDAARRFLLPEMQFLIYLPHYY